MENLFKKYYEMDDNEKEDLEKLKIIHELEKQLFNYEDLELDMTDEEVLFEAIRDVLPYSNIKDTEIISRLLEMLNCRDITVDDIVELDTKQLTQLITNDENDFKEIEYKIITEFQYGNYYCVFVKQGEKFILVYDKDDNSHVDMFNSLEEILCYVIKNKLLSEGESIV